MAYEIDTPARGELKDIFKVPLYTVGLDLDVKKIEEFCNENKKLNEKEALGRIQSNVGGYQSLDFDLSPDSLAKEPLQSLIKKFEAHATVLAQNILNKDDEQLVANMWVTMNGYKDSHKSHIHPGGVFSGVYYVKVPEGSGTIDFENPYRELLQYYFFSSKLIAPKAFKGWYEDGIYPNAYTSESLSLQPAENLLVLFPSFLRHLVNPNKNKTEERIAIAFNTQHKG